MAENYAAVNDLRAMFPDVDAEIVQAVFEASQRNLDATVAALIEISDPEAARQEQARNPRSTTVVPVDTVSNSTFGNAYVTSTPADQLASDEIFARSLQDEGFVQHLQQREDFARQLDEDTRVASSSGAAPQDQSFKEKLANMSDATKRKFRDIYNMFRKRGGDGSSSNAYSSLPHDEEEMTVLRKPGDDDDEDEDKPLERRGRF